MPTSTSFWRRGGVRLDGRSVVVGLTGGFACGKSTVGAMLEEHGWRRIDSDAIVRDLLKHDRAVIAEVRQGFGPDVFAPDGTIDRRRLATVVFADDAALERLEAILHPRVRTTWKAAVTGAGPQPWVVEIPLLFENGLEKEFDFTVCVASDARIQAERLALRGFSPHDARRRIARQLPLAQKIERADFVITNNGSLAFLRAQVQRLVEQLTRPTA